MEQGHKPRRFDPATGPNLNTTDTMKHTAYLKHLKEAKTTPTATAMVEAWVRTGQPIRPVTTKGSGKRTTNDDRTSEVLRALEYLGVNIEATGNDAPRGGLTGKWIQPTRASWRKFAGTRATWQAEQEQRNADRIAKEQQAAKDYTEQRERERIALEKWNGDGSTGENLLIRWGLFAASHNISIRTAPTEVRQEKDRLNISWNTMKQLRKPYLTR
jgi:hypothetical protein